MSDDGSSMRRENVVTESAEPPIGNRNCLDSIALTFALFRTPIAVIPDLGFVCARSRADFADMGKGGQGNADENHQNGPHRGGLDWTNARGAFAHRRGLWAAQPLRPWPQFGERGRPNIKGCSRYLYWRVIISATQQGFSAPSVSIVTENTASVASATSRVDWTARRARTRSPGRTAEGKRTRFNP